MRRNFRVAAPALMLIGAAFMLLGFPQAVLGEGPFCTSTGAYSVCTDQTDYAPNETVHVSGSGFGGYSSVIVKVTRPDGSVVTGDGSFAAWPTSYDTVVADGSGQFFYSYILDGIFGTYLIEVFDAAGPVLATHTFTDGNVRVRTNGPGITFDLVFQEFDQLGCTGSIIDSGTDFNVGNTAGTQFNEGVGNTDSIRLTAEAFSNQGGPFINWTAVDTNGLEVDPDLPSSALTICVPGFSGTGSRLYLANYGAPVGTVIIQKNTVGGDDTFGYTTTGTGLSNFSITTSGGIGSETFSNIPVGSKTVTESAPPAGWMFTTLICSDPDNGTTVIGQTANIDLDGGETVVCTYTNTKLAQITVVKNAVPNDIQDFTFQNNFGNGNPATFMLDDDGNNANALPSSQTFVVSPGSGYFVSEDAVSGWKLSSATCSGVGNTPASITVGAGESVTCTFTNKKLGNIKVVKNTVGGDDTFDFTTSGGDGLPANFSIATVSGFGSQTFTGIDPDNTYSISEIVPAGWDLTNVSCENENQVSKNPNGFTVNSDGIVVCTFTNTKRAKLTVFKSVINDHGGGLGESAFMLHVKSGGVDVAGSPQAGSNTGTMYSLSAGTYTVSEDTPPAGYVLLGISGDCDANGNVTLAPGDEKSCTITNDDLPARLTVIKHVVNGFFGIKQASDFTMIVTGTDVSQPSFAGAESPGVTVELDAGSYSVDEVLLLGYAKSLSSNCAGSIGNGEHKTCTVTNTALSPCQMTPTIVGTPRDDILLGTPGPDVIFGMGGNDIVDGRGGDDFVCTLAGHDNIRTRSGHDSIEAGDGKNVVNAGDGNNIVKTGKHDDNVATGAGGDNVHAGEGANTVNTNGGNDSVKTGNGIDNIDGGTGIDSCMHGAGADVVRNCE